MLTDQLQLPTRNSEEPSLFAPSRLRVNRSYSDAALYFSTLDHAPHVNREAGAREDAKGTYTRVLFILFGSAYAEHLAGGTPALPGLTARQRSVSISG